MQKYVCEPCGYVYDPEVGDPDNGIAPGTAFEDLPEDWVCQSVVVWERKCCGRVVRMEMPYSGCAASLFGSVDESKSWTDTGLGSSYNSQIRSLILPAIPLGLWYISAHPLTNQMAQSTYLEISVRIWQNVLGEIFSICNSCLSIQVQITEY